jgi:hypothetical protein
MNWQAKWIWAQSLSETRNCYVYARREFDISAAPSADACVTCSSEYKLYVNGRYIGRGPSPCDSNSQYYDTHDLSHILRPGKNVIAAICYNYGVQANSCPAAPGGFLLQLTLHHNGDEDQIIATDDSWRVLPGRDWDFDSARMSPTIGFQEVYDSRRKPVGWNVVGFDDTAWQVPFIVGDRGCEPWTNLVPRQIPPLKEWEVHPQRVLSCGTITTVDDPALDIATRIYAEQTNENASAVKYAKEMLSPSGDAAIVSAGPDCFVVLDFGMEVVGHPGLRIRGAGSATIDIGYSEALDETGRVFPTREGVLQADRLILHGGRQEWQTFGRRAFRYAQLSFRNLDTPISIESVYVSRIGYPVELASTFECSDDLLNEIWRTGVHALSLCMQDDYERSPLSDRVARPGDARVQALINYYSFFDFALAAKALEAFAQSPANDLIWVTMLHDYLLHTADLGLIRQLYPFVRPLIENSPESDRATRYQALRDASMLASALSNSEDALHWHEQANAAHCDSDGIEALAKLGKTKEALDQIRSRWGEMLGCGATTWCAETGEGDLCRGASGAPTYFLPAEILGVKPGIPGSDVVIQPRVGDLAWAKGHIKTVSGFVDVEWHSETDLFRIDIESQPGFIVALPVGAFTNPTIDEIDLTPETPERRARRTYGWGTTIWRDGQEHDPYLDWLATQEARPPDGHEPKQRCSTDQLYIWVRESVSTHVRYEVREG